MLKIRLQRIGRKNEPSFRLVLTESKNAAKSGKSLEVLGSHDFRKTNTILQTERIQYWLSQGVQVSDTAHNLLVTHKILSTKKRNVLPKKTVAAKEVVAEAPAPVAPVAKEAAPAPVAEVVEATPTPVEAPVVETPADAAPEATA